MMFDRIKADIDRTFFKPAFAITKVIFPQPPEPMIEAQLFDFRPVGHKTIAPFCESLSIGMTEVFHFFQHQTRFVEMSFKHLV